MGHAVVSERGPGDALVCPQRRRGGGWCVTIGAAGAVIQGVGYYGPPPGHSLWHVAHIFSVRVTWLYGRALSLSGA